MFKRFLVAASALMVLAVGCGEYAPGIPGFASSVTENDVPPGTDRPALEAGGDVVGDVTGDVIDVGGDAPSADVVGDDGTVIPDRPEPTDRPLPGDADGGTDAPDASEASVDVPADVPADRVMPDVPVTDIAVDGGTDVVDAPDVFDAPTDVPADRPVDTGPPCGMTLCGGACVNLQSDSTNCGRCGNACPVSQVCSAGVCGVSCGPGTTNCGGDCVDLATDTNNCGACFTTCGVGAHAVPVCRGIGRGCGFTCEAGYLDCNGNAADGCEVISDTRNCGMCGRVCAFANAAATCATGTCVLGTCNAGFGNCDGIASNGCETALNLNGNCGVCGRTCMGATSVCNGSACVQCTADRDCTPGYRCNTGTNTCYVVVPRMRYTATATTGTGSAITAFYARLVNIGVTPTDPAYVVTPDLGGARGTWRLNPCIGGASSSPIVCPELNVASMMPSGVTWSPNFVPQFDELSSGTPICGADGTCRGCWTGTPRTWSCGVATCIAGGNAPIQTVTEVSPGMNFHQLNGPVIGGVRQASCIPTP